MKTYIVYLAFDKPIVGFSYPPFKDAPIREPEENEIALSSQCYAMIGDMKSKPWKWFDKSSAESVAKTLGGYVEVA